MLQYTSRFGSSSSSFSRNLGGTTDEAMSDRRSSLAGSFPRRLATDVDRTGVYRESNNADEDGQYLGALRDVAVDERRRSAPAPKLPKQTAHSTPDWLSQVRVSVQMDQQQSAWRIGRVSVHKIDDRK